MYPVTFGKKEETGLKLDDDDHDDLVPYTRNYLLHVLFYPPRILELFYSEWFVEVLILLYSLNPMLECYRANEIEQDYDI